MKKKLISVLFVLLLIFISVGIAPINADTNIDGLSIGDTRVASGGYVETFYGYDNYGRALWNISLGLPQYCDDLVTPIDCTWYYSSENNTYNSGDNKYSISATNNELINLRNSNKQYSLSWMPTVSINNLDTKNKGNYSSGIVNQSGLKVKISILSVDPINSNYRNNVLQYDYGNGLYHWLRLIEGMLCEYYVITEPIHGDYVINPSLSNITGLFTGTPCAWDSNFQPVQITVDTYGNITLPKEKSIDSEIKYPIFIDPDVAFVSSSYDGFNGITYLGTYGSADSWLNAYAYDYATVYSPSALYSKLGVVELYDGDSQWWSTINRAYLYFDTSAIPDGATITSADMQFYPYQRDYTISNFTMQLQTGGSTYPHAPFDASDYNYTYYAGDGGSISVTSLTLAQYNTLTLNSTGISWINKTGITKFCWREVEHDINNSAPSYTTSAHYNDMYFYAYEKGVGYYPIFNVTYASASPTIDSGATTNITTTTARLPFTVTYDGLEGCQVRAGYGTVSKTTAQFASYTTLTSWLSSNYSTDDTGYFDITSLADNTTYYWRVQIKNTSDNSVSETEQSFSTYSSVPLISLIAASSIAKTSARINSLITNDGFDTCYVRWGYGTTTQTADNFALYDTVTSWSITGYSSGQHPYYDLTSLTAEETYYYRVQIKNSTDNSTCSTELSFTTLDAISNITVCRGIPTSANISYAWTKSDGSTNTLIVVSTSGFPTSNTTGTTIYFGSLSNYDYTGLEAGKTYFASFWGESGDAYSATPAQLAITTLPAGVGGLNYEAPASPNLNQTPTASNLQKLEPFYSIINNIFLARGIPTDSGWFGLFLFLTAIIGLLVYLWAKDLLAAMVIVLVCMIISAFVINSPYWIVLIIIMLGVVVWQFKSRNA